MLVKLKEIIGDINRVYIDQIDEKYFSDHLGHVKVRPGAVVVVKSAEEVSGIMKFAYEHNIPVIPRGTGTGLTGGTVPVEGSIVIDLSQLNGIKVLDGENLTLTVETGVLLEEVQRCVEAHGLFYPPDPGEKASTIGGNISTNAGGMRAVKYGVTRDYVRRLEVVLADGTILNLGSKTIKDSSGLDLKDLMIGSEGTLGIITAAELKLLPKPKFTVSALAAFNSLEEGIDSVLDIKAAGVDVAAIEFVEQEAISLSEQYLELQFPTHKGKAYLLFTFDGNEKDYIIYHSNEVERLCKAHGSLEFIVLENQKVLSETWQIRGAIVKAIEAVSEQEPIDIVVPINKSAAFVKYTKEVASIYDINIQSFGHAGDGNVHLCIIRGDLEESVWKEKLNQVLEVLYNKAHELEGLPSGEHGIGLTKLKYYLNYTNPQEIALMRGIKRAFDSKGILNPHKAY